MAGRNNRPDNDGPTSGPSQLGQYGSKLGSDNDEEFQAAVEQACEVTGNNTEPDH